MIIMAIAKLTILVETVIRNIQLMAENKTYIVLLFLNIIINNCIRGIFT